MESTGEKVMLSGKTAPVGLLVLLGETVSVEALESPVLQVVKINSVSL